MTVTRSLAWLGYPQYVLVDVDELMMRGEGRIRPWGPYKANYMRLYNNNKTGKTPEGKGHGRRNVTGIGVLVSVVRGCGLARAHKGKGCYGNCYSAESMARQHIKYWIPVPQIFNERLLRQDLQIFSDTRKKHGYEFIRTGDRGEPSYSWINTTALGDLSIQHHFLIWCEK